MIDSGIGAPLTRADNSVRYEMVSNRRQLATISLAQLLAWRCSQRHLSRLSRVGWVGVAALSLNLSSALAAGNAPFAAQTPPLPTSSAAPADPPTLPANQAAIANDQCRLIAGPERAVVAILDPETVRLDDGSEVRLLGMMGPISLGAKAERWPPMQAAQAALEKLLAGRSVALAYDKQRRNRYGQILAQLYRIDGKERLWVQRELIAAGQARVRGSRENNSCLGDLLAAEQSARRARRGLWSHAAFQIRPAWRTRELLRYRQRFELVEGTVRAISQAGNRLYLNFGRRWQEDFTVAIDARDRRAFEKAGIDLKGLTGQRLRVRGWIERRNGPLIQATYPQQIEKLAGTAKTSRKPRRTPARRTD